MASEAIRPDERLARVGFVSQLLQRAEVGALIGTVAVFILFTLSADGFASLDVAATWSDVAANFGIVAVPVALLMIGGEFDLSAGVMTGSSGLLFGLLVTRWDVNVWPAILLVLLFGMAVGLVNGMAVMLTQLPSFIVTLGTFFVLRGINAGGTLAITDTVRVSGIDDAPGYSSASKILANTFWDPLNFTTTGGWWLLITILGSYVLTRIRFGYWLSA